MPAFFFAWMSLVRNRWWSDSGAHRLKPMPLVALLSGARARMLWAEKKDGARKGAATEHYGN
jgi:hypothetical protein